MIEIKNCSKAFGKIQAKVCTSLSNTLYLSQSFLMNASMLQIYS